MPTLAPPPLAATALDFTAMGESSVASSRRPRPLVRQLFAYLYLPQRWADQSRQDSPYQAFSTSINMGEPGSLATSANAFGLPSGSMSSSYRRSYAAAAGGSGYNLASSFASMSFQPMSLGTSYSKSQVHNLMHTRSDAELTKAYECCGHTHEGLHALLEHVEDAHPFSDPDIPDTGFSPGTHMMELEMEGVDGPMPVINEKDAASTTSGRSSQSPNPVRNYPLPPSASKPTTPTEVPPVPLRMQDVLTSPLENNLLASKGSSSTSSPSETLLTPTTSAQPSPVTTTPKLNAGRTGFLGSTAPRPAAQQKRLDRAFNEVVASAPKNGNTTPTAVAPGVLFASAVAGLGIPTTPPVPGQKTETPTTTDAAQAPPPPPSSGNAAKVVEAQQPQPSLFSTHKPWRCPNPGCNKAYKQSNGLKYHQQKGQCDFAIHDAVDLGLSIEEAEERSRPFVCAVGAGCTKRYRQMNGLKYHYLNSGEHGQYGLRMLQNGTHPHPPSLPQPVKRPQHLPFGQTGSGGQNGTSGINSNNLMTGNGQSTTHNIPNANANTSNGHGHPTHTAHQPRPQSNAPYAVPSKAIPGAVPRQQHGHQMQNGPRMGIWPSKPQPPKPSSTPQMPVQRGRDAVLFAAVGNDPLDVGARIEI